MMAASRILHVAAVEFTATRLLAPQLHYLQDQGYTVHIACSPEGKEFNPALKRFEPRPVAFPRALQPIGMARGITDLRAVIREFRPDAVHFHSPAAAIPGRLGLAVRPVNMKVVYTVHGFLHQWDRGSRRDVVIERTERLLSARTDLSLFQSLEDYEAALHNRYRGRLRFLGNGIADDWFTGPRTDLGSRDPREFIYVGRLSREKGVVDLLDAVRTTPSIRLTLVGAALPTDRDDVSAMLRQLVTTYHLADRVRFAGMVDPAEVRQYLRSADVFVLPSWREGVPRSIIEAMGAGLPVVATDIRGCRELITPGKQGWLVPPHDQSALANALAEAASIPRERLERLGRSAFERAVTQCRESAVFERLLTSYEEIGLTPG